MHTQLRKPWLDLNGLPLSDEQLQFVSRRWDQKIWEEYLSWFECPLKESQLKSAVYDELAGKMTESIFSLSSSSECNYTTICFDELLALLTPKQKIVIEMIYWQGKSEKEIAKYLGVSRCAIQKFKRRALAKLKRNIECEKLSLPETNNNQQLNAG